MKTPIKILFVAAVSGVATAYAGPSPQFWNRPATKTSVATPAAQSPVQAVGAGLKCSRMLVPKPGASKQSPVTVVICTPEMVGNDWRCQQPCAAAAKS